MKFLSNENFPVTSTKLIRNNGYDIISISENSLLRGITDKEVLELANKENRIILTFDRDYGELIYKNKIIAHYGVVYFRFNPVSPKEPYETLTSVIVDKKVSLINKFTIIERNKIRQRSLINKPYFS